MQETRAVPDPVTLPGLIAAHVKPVGILSLRLTSTAKPFTAVMVIAGVAETPTLTAAGEDADTLKSCTRKSVVAEWLSEPLVPVTVSV